MDYTIYKQYGDNMETVIITLYIAAFILGAVVAALNIITYKKKMSIESSLFKNLSILLLFYIILEFYIFYNAKNGVYDISIRLIMPCANLCYYLFIYYWIKLLSKLTDLKFNRKIYISIIVLYGFALETMGQLRAGFNSNGPYIFVEEGIIQNIMATLNLCFGLWLLFFSIYFLYKSHKIDKESKNKNVATLLSAILFFYMIWVISFDYRVVKGRSVTLYGYIDFDPMLIFYITYSLSVIIVFYLKDPLGILKKENEFAESNSYKLDNEIYNICSSKYGLTNREREVLELICKGKSNIDIGNSLYIAENTVKRHINNIFNKVNVKSRYELISLILNKKD